MTQIEHFDEADKHLRIFAGGGDMGALMRSMDWSQTPLGSPATWPQSLRTAVSILLNSRYPMFVFWGPSLVKIYNDGYRPITGGKHPWAMGRPATEVWPEIWDTIGPMVDRVIKDGEATWSDDLLLFMERNGFPEEVYFTFSYSPVRDETGGVGGLFCACTETTEKVLSERRLRTLHLLAARPAHAKTVDQTCQLAAEILASNVEDIPFSLIYTYDASGALHLAACSGFAAHTIPQPRRIEAGADCDWPFAEVSETLQCRRVENLPDRFTEVPAGPWPEPPKMALVLPLGGRGGERPAGVIVMGTSSRRPFDAPYQDFLSLVAGQVATSIAQVQAAEEERHRAEALAALDRAKTAFFSNVSHEFRTPLTLMLGPLEETLAQHAADLPAAVAEQINVAYRNSLRLLRLVNSLLDFSRIEAGRIRAVYEPTDLAGLTADLASNFRSACERAGLRLLVECKSIDQMVYVDRDMWEKIVLNLLSNAFKFTFDGEIAVALRQLGDTHVELRVRDTGCGIPAVEMPRLFERFHRVENAQARTHEGSGIGLALVQELVKLHGGTVSAESIAGEGTTFSVTIPTGYAHLPAEQIGGERGLASTATGAIPFVEEALRWLPDSDESPSTRDGGAEVSPLQLAQETDAERPRILVADDNADMRDYVRRLLSDAFDVELAVDGKEALAKARARPPDLLLADIMMPRLDGFGLLRALRADETLGDVPVILLSARAGEDARIEGLAASADDYLIKPFSARELLARIESHIRMARYRRRVEASLREREEYLRTVVETSPECIAVVAADGKLLQINSAGLALMGVTAPEAVIGRCFYDWIAPEDRAAYRQFNESVCRGDKGSLAFDMIDRDGSRRRLESHAAPLTQADGSTAQLALTRDISERLRSEAALRASEAHFRAMADTAPALLWTSDIANNCTFVSRGWYEYTGQVSGSGLGLGWLRAVHEDERNATMQLFLAATQKREACSYYCRIRTASGEYRWTFNAARPRFDPLGNWQGYIGSIIDVHVWKLAEIATRQRSEQVRRLAEVARRIGAVHQIAAILQIVADEARNVIGAHQAMVSEITDGGVAVLASTVSMSSKYSEWANASTNVRIFLPQRPLQHVMRLSDAALKSHTQWPAFEAASSQQPPLRGWLAAPITAHNGRQLGVVQVSEKEIGNFSLEDEHILVQLAQMAAVAMDNAQLYAQLRQADRRKDEFLATLAHELRNPLAPIRTGLAVMKTLPQNDQSWADLHATLERQTRQLVTLVDDLLDISRITRGKLELRYCQIGLAEVVRSAVEVVQPLIEQRHHQLSVNLPVKPPLLHADPNRLAQVLSNLLNNAAKYTPEGGHIELTATCVGHDVNILVRDNGIGIPRDMLAGIFDMFTQVDRPQEKGYTGLGIGLTLAKSLVGLHGGRIDVSSAGPGQGSTFTVCLPTLAETAAQAPADTHAQQSTSSPSRRRVLVVDDNRDAAETLALLIKILGNDVRVAGDGVEAISVASEFRPDIVLMDIGMPRMNGFEAARHIRQQPWGADMMLVALTGWGQKTDKRRTKQAGFDRHLIKPIEPGTLQKLFAQVGEPAQ